MRRFLSYILLLVIVFSPILSFPPSVKAQTNLYEFDTDPIVCNRSGQANSCPTDFVGPNGIYSQLVPPETCALDFADFKTDPIGKHYWVEDPAITAQGQADERARQFMYWVLNTNVIDEAPVLRTIWTTSSTVALFGIVLVAAIFGIGYIVSQRTNYDFKIQIRPSITKIGLMLLYTVLSAALIFSLIQFSEVIMQFFYENLGGKDLFNIYFVNPGNANLLGGTEASYTQFFGCRDLNIRVQEAANTELFMLKLTNVSYYVLGTMLLLRKILLWFLLFVSPFLALLMPFILIRNTGWIWIGVFFQWLFYGPLVALFLGAMSKIWAEGIPFSFDFSRAGNAAGYIYPTAINIVYGGPGQRLGTADTPIGALNNGNYIDTFAEYIITLIMLWAVTFFPWWLLRIFRDYCCDGIYAMKNILMRLYDHMRNPIPPGGPSAPHNSTMPTLNLDANVPVSANVNVALGSMAQMRKSMTTEIVKNMNMKATNLTDIARVETNKQLNQTVNQHLAYLANPVKAQQSNQRQQYMQLRSELFNRTIKKDTIARTILASTSTSASERAQIHKSLMQSMPQAATMNQIMSQVTSVPTQNISHITNTYITNVVNNASIVKSIAQQTGVSEQNVTSILKSYTLQQSKPIQQIVSSIAQATNTNQKEVTAVLQQANNISNQSRIMTMVTSKQNVSKDVVSKILNSVKTITQSSASHTSNLAQQMNTDEKTITSIVSTAYESVSKDTTQLQNIAQSTSTDTSLVQKVLTSYIQHISEPHESLISTISTQTHVSQPNVTNIMQQASQVVQSTPIIESLAQSHNLTKEQIITVITPPIKVSVSTDTSTQYTPAIQMLTRSASAITQTGDATTSSQQTVQNVFNTITNNESMISSIATASSTTNENVSRVISAFAQNTSSSMHNIAYSTNLKESEVTTILQNTSSAITKSQEITQFLATGAHVDISKVQEIARAIPQVIAATSVSTDQFILSQSSEQLSTDTIHTIVTNISNAPSVTNNAQSKSIMQSFANHITEHPAQIMKSITQETNQDISSITNVLQNISSTLRANTNEVNSVAMQSGVSTTQITSVLKALPQIVTESKKSETIFNEESTAPQTTISKTHVQQIIRAVSQNESIIQSITQNTQISTTDVKNVVQSYATHVDEPYSALMQNITQETHIQSPDIHSVIQELNTQISRSTDAPTRIASTNTDITEGDIRKVFSTLSQIQTIQNQTIDTPHTQTFEQIYADSPTIITASSVYTTLTSLSQNESIVQQIAQEANTTSQQVKTVLNTYVQSSQSTPQQFYNSLVQNQNITTSDSHKIIQAVGSTLSNSIETRNSISAQTNLSANEISHVAQALTSVSNKDQTTQTDNQTSVAEQVINKVNSQQPTTSFEAPLTTESITTMLQTLSTNEQITHAVMTETRLEKTQVTQAIQTFISHINDPYTKIVEAIMQETNITKDQSVQLFQSLAQTLESSPDIQQNIATQSHTSTQTVQHLAQGISLMTRQATDASISQSTDSSVSSTIASSNNVDVSTSDRILKSLIQNAVHNESFVQNLAKETNLKEQQVTNALTTYVQNISKPQETIVTTINQAAGIAKQDIPAIFIAFANNISRTDDIIAQVAKQENVSEDQVSELMDTQVELASEPEKHIEKTITIPQSISLEDYEEVKEMWIKHYEESEVPVSDTIKTRHDWLDHEMIYITNTLNKIMSSDEKLQQKGLDELGFLLPIFLINSLSGEELLVYLKAKLEAAKTVLKVLNSKESVRKEMTENEEEEILVDVTHEDSQEVMQPMHMELEEDKPVPQSIEDRVKSIQDRLVNSS